MFTHHVIINDMKGSTSTTSTLKALQTILWIHLALSKQNDILAKPNGPFLLLLSLLLLFFDYS